MCYFNASFEIVLNSWKNQTRDIKPGSILKAAKDSVPEHTLRQKNAAHNHHQTKPMYTFAEWFLSKFWGQTSDQTPTVKRNDI